MQFHTYWLNKKIGTVNCLMEASSPEQAAALHKAAHGLVADKIIEVDEVVVEAFLGQIAESEAARDPATLTATMLIESTTDNGVVNLKNSHSCFVTMILGHLR